MSEGRENEGEGLVLAPEMPSDMRALLGRFAKMMEDSKILPLSRKFDHHIRLKEEAKPVNVTPYKYAHYQKTEIEKQVGEILSNGLIRPSTSLFSNPVLLVKKKDGF